MLFVCRLRGPLPPSDCRDRDVGPADEESRDLLPWMESGGIDAFGWGRVGKVGNVLC